jgi:hypothetical protein
MIEILMAQKQRQWNRMGVFLALALIKPNVMLLPVVVLAAWLIRNQNWRPVLVAAATLLALIIVTTALTPEWYKPFFQPNFRQGLTQVLDGPNKVTAARINTTLLDWLQWLSLPKMARYLIYSAVLLAGLWVVGVRAWRSKSILEVAAVSVLVSFAVTPYALQYDFPPLAVVLYWALAASAYAMPKLIPILIVLFIASVLIWERPISDGYWIVIGLSVLAAWSSRAATVDISVPATT